MGRTKVKKISRNDTNAVLLLINSRKGRSMKSNIFIPFFSFVIAILLIQGCSESEHHGWEIADSPLLTHWATEINPENVWQEYPRPQMVRQEWLNLNGLWDYAIVTEDSSPMQFDGRILVPFPVESALSGVGKRVAENQRIWYQREVKVPVGWVDKIILLHFEASDWETTLYIDGKKVGEHRGGYDPFSFDITPFVKPGKRCIVRVSVWDPTDKGFQPRGKQVGQPRGIWYTPSSGIWQTVWMEPVGRSYMERFFVTTDIDQGMINIVPSIKNASDELEIDITVSDNGREVAKKAYVPGQDIMMLIPDAELWSPENPHLYDLRMRLIAGGEVIDEVGSYFGMRKIAVVQDELGYNRLALNNEILFQNGPLDQGFWPDGLYTPPSDAAMKYDIEKTISMGFNMLRKHVKVENRRFYHWCDRLGMLVWQDMPSAAGFIAPDDEDLQPSEEHKDQFEYELEHMILTHFNHPSIVMWVPFNEGWGQYDTERIVGWIKSTDSTRLVNNASGWTDRGVGDVIDIHHYPDPRCPDPEENRASVLGEFGGLGLYVEGHVWQEENWGYEKMQEVDELLVKYEDFYREINRMKDECGLAAAVYTQTTDVETETNGLMTYDRAEVKMGVQNIYNAHLGIIPPRLNTSLRHFIDSIPVGLVIAAPDAAMQYCFCNPGEEDNWQPYVEPLVIKSEVTLKTRSVWADGTKSRQNSLRFFQATPFPSIFVETANGLSVTYFEGTWDKLPDFDEMEPVNAGTAEKVDLAFSGTNELFGLVFEGYLDVPETDVYLFSLSSDDGARMYLDGEECIDYDGIHGAGFRKVSRALEKGLHPFRLVYFQRFGGLGLNLYWESQQLEYQEVNPEFWKH